MALKAAEIRAFPALVSAYRKTDEKGLYLEIRPNGAKRWFFKYRVLGSEKRLTLGDWPEVSLVQARELRDDARRAVREGGDPLHERKREKTMARLAAGNSFQSVAEDFIEVKFVGGQKAAATIEKARWYLSHLTGPIGGRPVSEIEPAELMVVLKKIEKAGKRETAVRTRAFASRVFRHGVAMSLCKSDPAALLGDALMSPIVTHRAAILDPRKLGALLRAIDDYGGSESVKIAMQLLPHVFVRPGELRLAKWQEIDWDEKIWRIPAERTKLRRPHSVPLSVQSLALFNELRRHTGWMDWMFPGERSHLKPMCENAINTAFRRMGFDRETVTAHGFRATASTLLNESGKWHPDAIERALAHGHSNAVRGAYARGQHWDERVQMAQWWSDYLEEHKEGAPVVPLVVKKGRR
ncbi:site-specific integrase [Sphingobium sp. PAMC28499]|uniref:tyrosine-type recombinase/integrase n=1 Tax=Sphingobium sp. PAMC28499 TaxID=2565554 RepID=UPI00109E0392|nr:site-specific integrase [Sphingobium sp. PAMC28499]QCB37832.1 site-specific integrase [Sphingobium sp. PAMC28499]